MSRMKDSIDAPALIIVTLLTLITFYLFSYIFYMMGTTAFAPGGRDLKMGDVAGGTAVPEKKDHVAQPEIELDDSDLRIVGDSSAKNFEIWNDAVKVGEIKEEVVSEVRVWKRIKNDIFFGVTKDNGVKDGPFGGPQEIYKLDLTSGAFSKIFDRDAFASDISLDESRLVSIERFYVGDEIYNYVNVYDLDSYKSQSYEPAKGCLAAGNAFFSKDGRRVAYETVVVAEGGEMFRMYVIDLETGEQTQAGDSGASGRAQKWTQSN